MAANWAVLLVGILVALLAGLFAALSAAALVARWVAQSALWLASMLVQTLEINMFPDGQILVCRHHSQLSMSAVISGETGLSQELGRREIP